MKIRSQIEQCVNYLIVSPMVILFFSCKAEVVKLPPPNIVWLVSEDNSMHYLKMFNKNGVKTPNIESLANQGLVYTHAFSNAAVCSAARSTIISGAYGPRLGAHYHRKVEKVTMPLGAKMFPAYLKEAGYYTSNNSKEDYNIIKTNDVWDDSSKKASWRNREDGQPFFHVYNSGITHEGAVHFNQKTFENKKTKTSLESFKVQPNHPNTKLFKYTNALYRDKMIKMDTRMGEVIHQLKEDGLYSSTFIFYYGDHGGVLPGSKGYLYETGLHVPMVVHVPEKYKHLVNNKLGEKVEGFVSFVDLAPTVLNLAGIEIPKEFDGKPFLGENVTAEEINKRNETFSYADRFDEKYDMVRAVRKGKYKYIRNYQPFNYDGLMNAYRYKQLAYKEWAALFKEGKLNAVQSQFFKSKKVEMLFDVEKDPFETNNLAENKDFQQVVLELRNNLNNRLLKMPDLSFYPEHFLIKNAFKNPVKFGQEHQEAISRYIKIANLSLSNFNDVKQKIEEALNSNDAWERYWAVIVCSSFGEEANEFTLKIKEIAKNDAEAINKVRALEYLGLFNKENTLGKIAQVLYKSDNVGEALLILNTMVLLTDNDFGYSENYNFQLLSKKVTNNQDVKNRIKYLANKY
ncbi:sulfatase [Polaribacter staleyi]|uniref:sulfatase family protein n=1 Tax=Polaribacter staleyi TaxID=2022337 RepID=UPI0031BB4CB9